MKFFFGSCNLSNLAVVSFLCKTWKTGKKWFPARSRALARSQKSALVHKRHQKKKIQTPLMMGIKKKSEFYVDFKKITYVTNKCP
jgi:hypothetical protein